MRGEGEGRVPKPTRPQLTKLITPSRALRARDVLTGRILSSPDVGKNIELLRQAQPDEAALSAIAMGDLPSSRKVTSAAQLFRKLSGSAGSGKRAPARISAAAIEAAVVDGLQIDDAWFVSARKLRLRAGPGQTGWLRAYQLIDGTLVACGGALLQNEALAFFDIDLDNPYFPILLLNSDDIGALGDALLLPFPSLFRGGAHHAEAAASSGQADRFKDLVGLSATLLKTWLASSTRAASISSLVIDPTGATGAERIFSRAAREWLTQVMQIAIDFRANAEQGASHADDAWSAYKTTDASGPAGKRSAQGLAELKIPAHAMPTIGALVARGWGAELADITGSFVVADAISAEPIGAAILPQDSAAGLSAADSAQFHLPGLSFLPGRKAAGGTPPAEPIAILYRRETTPVELERNQPSFDASTADQAAPKTRSVSVLAQLHGEASAARMFASLATQTLADGVRVRMVCDDAVDLDRIIAIGEAYFPDRAEIGHPENPFPAKDIVVVIDDSIVLHDPQTIERLVQLAAMPHIASAGCLHLSQAKKGGMIARSSGLFLVGNDNDAGSPVERPLADIFPGGLYPTAGNSWSLCAIPGATWKKFARQALSLPVEHRAAAFAFHTIAAGLRHVATSETSAMVIEAASSSPAGAPPSLPWLEVSSQMPRIRALS